MKETKQTHGPTPVPSPVEEKVQGQDQNLNQVQDEPQERVQIPLIVDLDGTLTPVDTTVEDFWWLLKHRPVKAIKALSLLLSANPKGQKMAKFKMSLTLEILKLNGYMDRRPPLNQRVLNFIKKEKEKGRKIILVTGSNLDKAKLLTEHLEIFDDYIGTKEEENLVGQTKAALLEEMFGKNSFDYIGNEEKDMHIWNISKTALIVESLQYKSLRKKTQKLNKPKIWFNANSNKLHEWAKALRIKHWVKNLLVFAPMIAAHKYLNIQTWIEGVSAMVAFCTIASATYMLNDLFDIEHDRKHHKKKYRPIAKGSISITQTLLISSLLLAAGLLIAHQCGILIAMVTYIIVTISYSLWIKSQPIVDVVTLSGLYCVRILAGGTATQTPVSFWMITFAAFLFLGLACIKRYAELANKEFNKPSNTHNDKLTLPGRGYNKNDHQLIAVMGVGASLLAPLVLALYLKEGANPEYYQNPQWLWAASGLTLIWMMNLWRDTVQGMLKEEDPIDYSITNRKSITTLLLLLLVLAIATKGGNI